MKQTQQLLTNPSSFWSTNLSPRTLPPRSTKKCLVNLKKFELSGWSPVQASYWSFKKWLLLINLKQKIHQSRFCFFARDVVDCIDTPSSNTDTLRFFGPATPIECFVWNRVLSSFRYPNLNPLSTIISFDCLLFCGVVKFLLPKSSRIRFLPEV